MDKAAQSNNLKAKKCKLMIFVLPLPPLVSLLIRIRLDFDENPFKIY